jgi:hypothetical protein
MSESSNPFADVSSSVYDLPSNQELPPIVPGSVLLLDADISSFYLAWPEDTLAQNTEALKRHIEVKRLMAGCEYVETHTTRGDKSGRWQASMVKEYQANRKSRDAMSTEEREKKDRVDQIRVFLETYHNAHTTPKPQWFMEADDSLSIAQGEYRKQDVLSKIMTLDKDLDMVAGTHIHYDTYEEWTGEGYGKLWLDETSSTKKLKGQGTSFFWAQLLMGDKADNVPGLPQITGALLNDIKPTKAIESAKATLRNAKATARARTAARRVLESRKAAPIGAVTAYDMLKNCRTDRQAYSVVRQAYTAYYGASNFQFQTWRGDTITANSGIMLLEQAKLLWMLRDADDTPLKFMQEMADGS